VREQGDETLRRSEATERGQRQRLSRWVVAGVGAAVVAAAAAVIVLAAGSSGSAGSFSGSDTPAGRISNACGAAVDSEGDVYVSSTGTSAINVFGPDGNYLGDISDPKKPCAIALDSKGNVYVLESATGEVVKYAVGSYPFQGSPSYGRPTTIDASGKATGVAIDASDGQLYVAEGDRIAVYNSNGTVGQDEVQRVYPFEYTGGSFKLSFEGRQSGPIPYSASNAEVEAALEKLPTIGKGNVSVRTGPNGKGDHLIAFTGALARTAVGKITGDSSQLTGRSVRAELLIEKAAAAFSGHIGEGVLSEVSGIAAYTYNDSTHYVFAADSAGGGGKVYVFAGDSARTLVRRATIDGSETPAGSIGFGPGGGRLGVDQKNGHVYVYDARHSVLDEFEAAGLFAAQTGRASLEGVEPAGIAVNGSSGLEGGTVYLANGAASGPDVLSLPPRPAPGHAPVKGLSGNLYPSCGIAVDPHGDVYVSDGKAISIYDPEGKLLKKLVEPKRPCHLAVDSEGNIYSSLVGREEEGDEALVLYRADSYPPTASTEYAKPQVLRTYESNRWVAVNPANDHLLVNYTVNVGAKESSISEYDSAAHGSRPITNKIGRGVLSSIDSFGGGLGVCAKTGNVYAAGRSEKGWAIYVLNPKGTEVLTAIEGAGSPGQAFAAHSIDIAVDQSNCHVYMADYQRPVEEYEASGAFVDEFGPAISVGDIAVDNGPSNPNRGNVYVAPGHGWRAFGPLGHRRP
jgi:hypothetical protein